MANILLITDQMRLRQLCAAVFAAPGHHLRVAGSVNQGVEELTFDPPDLLLVQEYLAGLGREVLIPHLSAASARPLRIVVLTERGKPGSHPDHPCIDLSLPDPELTELLLRQVTGSGQPAPARPAPTPEPASAQPSPSLTGLIETVTDAVSVPRPPGRTESPFDRQLADRLMVREKQELPTPLPPPAESASPDILADATGVKPPTVLAWSRIALGVTVLAIATGLIWGVLGRERSRMTRNTGGKEVVPREVPPRPVPAPSRLPSFIPAAQLDPLYSDNHPGWERYLTPGTEYKLFREQGRLRALQIIDRGGNGIAANQFDAVLKEMAGTSRYTVESRQPKDEFILERAIVPPATPLIIYRKQSDHTIKAFVINLP